MNIVADPPGLAPKNAPSRIPMRWTKWVMSVIGLLAASMFALWMMMVPHPAIPTAQVDRDHLKVWLDDIVSGQAATAISIAVIQDGEVAWEMASGTANPDRKQKATPQTRYTSGL